MGRIQQRPDRHLLSDPYVIVERGIACFLQRAVWCFGLYLDKKKKKQNKTKQNKNNSPKQTKSHVHFYGKYMYACISSSTSIDS